MPKIEEDLSKLVYSELDKAIEAKKLDNLDLCIEHLTNAWQLLPEPKVNYEESYLIAFNKINVYIAGNKLSEAKKNAELIYSCDPDRFDDGERDFINGKVAFEIGDEDTAYKLFDSANEKSGGRCFENHGDKYVEFFFGEVVKIDDETYEKIDLLSAKGDEHFKQRDYDKAIETYNDALDLIPEPKVKWNASLWLYVALGDSYTMMQEFEIGLEFLYKAYNMESAIDNPFINLRIGQCYYELGNFDQALNFLLRAYMLDGERIFKGAQFYLNFLKSRQELGA